MSDSTRVSGSCDASRSIRVSVVVPARDEAKTLPALLNALLAQTRPVDEIVVVDAGSVDETFEVLTRYGPKVRVLSIGPALPGAARNAAISQACHPWLAMIDAGCRPEYDWLEQLLAPVARDPDLDVVFGEHVPLIESEWDRIQALSLMAPRDASTGVHGPSVASMLLRRSLWEKTGGFRGDLRAAEDHLFFSALRGCDAHAAWAPLAVVHWQLSQGPWSTFRRLCAYSKNHLRAGLFHTWHRRVMLMHATAIALFVVVSAPVALTAAVVLLIGRAFATAWRRRNNVAEPAPLSLPRVVGVAFALLLADAAVWVGAASLVLRGR